MYKSVGIGPGPHYTAIKTGEAKILPRLKISSTYTKTRTVESFCDIEHGTMLAAEIEDLLSLLEIIKDKRFPTPRFLLFEVNLPEEWPVHPVGIAGFVVTPGDIPREYVECLGAA